MLALLYFIRNRLFLCDVVKGNLLPAYESGILIIVHNVEVSCWRKHEQDIRWMGTKVRLNGFVCFIIRMAYLL